LEILEVFSDVRRYITLNGIGGMNITFRLVLHMLIEDQVEVVRSLDANTMLPPAKVFPRYQLKARLVRQDDAAF
jgi:hypothetical protein